MKKPKMKFYVEKQGFWTQAAVIFMALAIVFRLIGCWGMWNDQGFLMTQIALPVLAGLLFIVFLVLLGRVALWSTFLPVLLGVAFFVLKAFTFESTLQTVLCVLLYVLVAVLYTGTVFTLIRTKWLLVPLFGLPFLYHVFVEDVRALQNTLEPVTFAAGMQEMSVLCIMLSLLFTAFAMKKLVKEVEVDLPKIKDPVVNPPKKEDAAAPAETPTPASETAPAPQPETPTPPPADAFEPGQISLTLDPEPQSDAPAADAGTDA